MIAKKQVSGAARKHDRKAHLNGAQRLTTQLTFATTQQAYLWTTDRGRSRLIKH